MTSIIFAQNCERVRALSASLTSHGNQVLILEAVQRLYTKLKVLEVDLLVIDATHAHDDLFSMLVNAEYTQANLTSIILEEGPNHHRANPLLEFKSVACVLNNRTPIDDVAAIAMHFKKVDAARSNVYAFPSQPQKLVRLGQ
ncbi:MAG: hypothetical protein AAGD04_09070 [Pseudomonadota bacterium]